MTRLTRILPAGDRRRLSDGRNAWRKMTPQQRREFMEWIMSVQLPIEGVHQRYGLAYQQLPLAVEATD